MAHTFGLESTCLSSLLFFILPWSHDLENVTSCSISQDVLHTPGVYAPECYQYGKAVWCRWSRSTAWIGGHARRDSDASRSSLQTQFAPKVLLQISGSLLLLLESPTIERQNFTATTNGSEWLSTAVQFQSDFCATGCGCYKEEKDYLPQHRSKFQIPQVFLSTFYQNIFCHGRWWTVKNNAAYYFPVLFQNLVKWECLLWSILYSSHWFLGAS